MINKNFLINNVKICPTVNYFGVFLNGMAKNNSYSAISMLCAMMKCLHGGNRKNMRMN